MDTIPQLLDYQARTRGAGLAMRDKRLGLWENLSWDVVRSGVQKFACGLADLGVGRGDTIAVIGGNTSRIFSAITACQCIGAVPTPIYGNLAGKELLHMLETLACRYVVAEDQQQVDTVLEVQSSALKYEAIIYTASRGMDVYDSESIYDFEEIQRRGERYMSAHSSFYADQVAAGKSEDVAMILFTSGVAGHPKPALLCHKHILAATCRVADLAQVNSQDQFLSFMPIFLPVNLLCGYVLSHMTGMCLNCPESSETVLNNLREISPSILYAPPHVYKQIYSRIRERMRVTGGLPRKLYSMFIEGQVRWPVIGDILVKSPLREVYGLSRLRLAMAGGDSLNAEVLAFFNVLGVDLRQIYGAAETFGCIAMQSQGGGSDNVGSAVSGMEIKISPEGEIMSRGETVFPGYYQDKVLTASVLDQDGWFHTGDTGSLNSDGTLTVADRLDAVGKLKAGTVFMPKIIEKEIKESIYIDEVFVSGDGEEFPVAMITIESGTVSAWAEDHNIRYVGHADLTEKPEVVKMIGQEVAAANLRLPDKQPKVKSLLVFHRQFAPQTGELTWTYKIRRQVLGKQFKSMLQALHSERENFEFDDPYSGSKIDFLIYKL